MHASLFRGSKLQLAALSGAVALALVAGSAQAQISQSGERKNINRLGHTDLQGRSSYQPNVIQYPDGRWIMFAGLHNTIPVARPPCPAGTLPNPLNGNACEANGTMIIDVTDPANPFETFHIPATPGGQSTMVRMCLGSVLPGGQAGKVYMLRGVQGGPSAGYEQWDVTNVSAPVRLKALTGLRSTHKDWWECNTGIAFMPGSKDPAAFAGTPVWRQSQAMIIFDWSNPHNGQPPVYIRTFGLPGGEPTGTGAVPNSLHGPISAHEHPRASQQLARGASATNDIIGNRIYAAWGVGDDGVMTIIDRKKLLPAAYGGTWVPATPTSADSPLQSELIGPTSPTVGYYLMSPEQGGHTSRPYFTIQPASFVRFSEFQTRDIVVMTSEATANTSNGRCTDAPHVGFVVDVTVENSITAPPGTRVEHDPYQGPMGLATLFVQPQFGERYPRGNYCTRAVRFGTHSTEENMSNPYDSKLTAIAWFNGGVRIFDIREPYTPTQVAFYVSEANANTPNGAYMTNNVEIDNRGLIYVVDRNGAGMDILQLFGCPASIPTTGTSCPPIN
jgi:hypothetical protein